MVSSDMESFVDLAWNQNANTSTSVEPNDLQYCFELDPSATSAHFMQKGLKRL